MKKADLEIIQQKINYTFANPKLLEQAFTTKSFAAQEDCADYELLEFFGDKILTFVLAKEYASYFCKIKKKQLTSDENEFSLTQRTSELIKNENLARRIEEAGLNGYVKKLAAEKFLGKREGDLFEAILGAVAVDSEWNPDALQKVVDGLLHPTENFEKAEYEKESFVGLLKNLCHRTGIKITNFQISVAKDQSYASKLTLAFDGNEKKFSQKAKTEIGAKLSVARAAYLFIKKFWLYQPAEEWIENPVSQLNSLRIAKWILSAKYDCTQLVSENAASEDNSPAKKTAWSCTCTVERPEGKTIVVEVEKPSQKKAKNAAALKALCIILNQIREEETGRGKGLLRLILEKYI
ncbi:MAG: ribonuclease III family protein [Treponema sp.]|nr:ribonuclease III family protein [Treponema sp.]